MRVLLEVKELSLSFGGLKALTDFELNLPAKSLQGLIGPNGAGKTTVFNLLTGIYQPQTGTIRLEDRIIEGLKPYQIAKAGIARTFQNIRLFGDLTVKDNVAVACHLRALGGFLSAVSRIGHWREETRIMEQADQLLEVFELTEQAEEQAKNLPYGSQRRLEIARALATGPKVLLLDEPAAGMNPQEKKSLKAVVQRIREQFGVAILLIEHDMGVVMDMCEEITVLDHGTILAHAAPSEIQKNPKVIEAYLGTS